jgi:hypothetical protein
MGPVIAASRSQSFVVMGSANHPVRDVGIGFRGGGIPIKSAAYEVLRHHEVIGADSAAFRSES